MGRILSIVTELPDFRLMGLRDRVWKAQPILQAARRYAHQNHRRRIQPGWCGGNLMLQACESGPAWGLRPADLLLRLAPGAAMQRPDFDYRPQGVARVGANAD